MEGQLVKSLEATTDRQSILMDTKAPIGSVAAQTLSVMLLKTFPIEYIAILNGEEIEKGFANFGGKNE